MTPKILLIVPASALALITGCGSTIPTAASLPSAPSAPAVTPEPGLVIEQVAAVKGMNATEKKVLALTNAARAKKGCRPLKANNKLALAARRHSKDMAVKHYFSHTSKDGSSPWDRIRRAGYKNPGAENIAYGYSSPKAVMKAWLKSPGHRANILNCKLKALGVGHYKKYWTQDFGWS